MKMNYSEKKIGEKLISVLVIAVMILTLTPVSLLAETETISAASSTNVKWTEGVTGGAIYFDESTGMITDCDEDVTKVELPETINGTKVTSIGEDAFSNCYYLESITLPKSITDIGDCAFYWCDSLTSITIPSSITSIGVATFYWCESLTSITIPDSVTSIGDGAFHACFSLSKIEVSDENEYYSSSEGVLFDKKKKKLIQYPPGNVRKSYIIPNNVTSIEDYAFDYCSSLTSITIPNSVTSIGYCSFTAESLTSIEVSNGNSYYSSSEGVLFDKEKKKLIQYPIGNVRKAYNIPNSVTCIGAVAFDGCSSLTSITIPDSVTSIGESAFSECHSLTDIRIPNGVTSIGFGAFSSCRSLTRITIPKSVKYIGVDALSSDKLTVYGYSGSYAETYAKSNDIPFVVITERGNIKEKDLYGEYCKYLMDNPAYKQMLGKVYADLDDIIYVDDTKAGKAAIATALKNGVVKNIKAAIGALTGNYYSEKELEEAVAQDLLNAVSSDKYLVSDITSETKRIYTASEKTYKMVSKGTKTATAIKAYASGFKNKYSEKQIIELIKSVNKNWESIDKIFDKAGFTINSIETAVMLIEARDADMYTVNKLTGKINKKSALHSGLMRIYNKNKGTTPEAMVKEWIKKDVFEYASDKVISAISGAVAPVEFGFYLVGVGTSLTNSGADMDDVDKAFIALSNDNQIRLAVSNVIGKMALQNQNGGNTDYSSDFKFLKEAQFKSLEICVKYANNVGTAKQKKKLNADYNKYKSFFNIKSYIKSCLANANADWSYRISSDGKAVITGVNKKTKSSASSLAESLGLVAYADDTEGDMSILAIPSEIDGYEVASIDSSAFADDTEIDFAYVPETVTDIGESAFEGCSNLKSVFLENGVEIIEGNAFADCSSLDEVQLPVTLSSIDGTAFSGNDSLTIYAVDGTEGQTYAEESNLTCEVVDPAVTKLEVTGTPSKTTYKMSEEDIDASGLEVTATLETGEEVDVSSDVYCYFKDKQLGSSKIAVVYEDCEAEYDITIEADECSYTVSYENELGDEIADKVSGTALAGTELKLDIKDIEGYIPQEDEITVTIGADNDFVVMYSKEPAIDISKAEFSEVKDVAYNGESFTPNLTVTYNGKTLEEDVDYTVTYDENVLPGSGLILIVGMGDFCGVKEIEFTIEPPDIAPQKSVSANLYGYDDFKISWSGQSVKGSTVKYKVECQKYGGSWSTISSGTTATYINKANLAGGARYAFRVTPYVTLGDNNFYGESKTTSYVYTLKKLGKPSVKKSSGKYVKVSWTNIPGESGYEIARSKYSNKKFTTVKRVSYKYKTVKIKTTKKKKYYYKIRAYKTVNGKRIYAPWSSVRSYTLR